MQIEQVDGTDERLAVSALCLDTEILARVAPALPENAFPSKWANKVAGWCLQHFKQFGEAPGSAAITSIYSEWAATADKPTASLVGKFLGSLSAVEVNADYCQELIERLVIKTAAKQLVDKVQTALSNGQLQAATDAIQGWKPPKIAEEADFVEPLANTHVVGEAFEKAQYAPLITFPSESAIGRWLGPTLHRDALVVLCGPDKSGKSSHLASLCQRAVVQGKRVAYVNIGDLSQEQAIKRWTTAFVGRPSYRCKYFIPLSIKHENKEFSLEYDIRFVESGYSKNDALMAWERLGARGDANRLRFVSRPANTLTVEGLRDMLLAWANKGWVPDVIGVDYAALLAPSRGIKEKHEALDHIWKSLRQISQELKVLLLTASQTNADSYQASTYWLSKANFAGSKGIWAHCNAAIGINMTNTERRQQVTRFNFIAQREREYLSDVPSEYIAVAGCPHIGRFHLVSEFL
jgi:hypothetical protein